MTQIDIALEGLKAWVAGICVYLRVCVLFVLVQLWSVCFRARFMINDENNAQRMNSHCSILRNVEYSIHAIISNIETFMASYWRQYAERNSEYFVDVSDVVTALIFASKGYIPRKMIRQYERISLLIK